MCTSLFTVTGRWCTIVSGSLLSSDTEGGFGREKKAELQRDTRANQPVWELLKYPFN